MSLKAQNQFADKLLKANEYYEQGLFNQSLDVLNTIQVSTLSPSEEWQLYHLYSLVYIAGDQTQKAKPIVEKMLKLNPAYKPSIIKDPPELTKLLGTIRLIPKLSIGLALNAGTVFSFPSVKETYNAGQFTKSYNSGTGWQVGIMTGYHLNPVISLNIMLMVTTERFNIAYAIPDWSFTINESISYLTLPAFARFNLAKYKSVSLFIDAGGYTGYLLRSTDDFTRRYLPDGENYSIKNLMTTDQKNHWEYGMIYGLGIGYNYKKVNITLDGRYYIAYANINNPTTRYDNQMLFYQFFYLNDNVSLSHLALTLSVNYHLSYKVWR
jgi:tetratricopeptide (TPR) repeat protein